jgi:protein-S-isoprenylcysteine O-methyltransferase Ste14
MTDATADAGSRPPVSFSARAYRAFGVFGIFSIFAALVAGFRYAPDARWSGLPVDLALFLVFAVPHLVMTRGAFKRAVWGDPAGSPPERRVYVVVGIVLWLVMLALHRPLPGPELALPGWLRFVGVVGVLMGMGAFLEGVTPQALDGLLCVPGAPNAFTHGAHTPLLTEGAYGSIRHPQYRAALVAAAASLLAHPNLAQLFWAVLFGGTFVLFIPIEEAQLLRERGEDYREYMDRTPWRLVPGIW